MMAVDWGGMTDVARPRGWYHGWNIVAVCIVSQVAANGLTYNAFSLFLRDWSRELHAPISRLQLAVKVFSVCWSKRELRRNGAYVKRAQLDSLWVECSSP
jgi:hypothetical protein